MLFYVIYLLFIVIDEMAQCLDVQHGTYLNPENGQSNNITNFIGLFILTHIF